MRQCHLSLLSFSLDHTFDGKSYPVLSFHRSIPQFFLYEPRPLRQWPQQPKAQARPKPMTVTNITSKPSTRAHTNSHSPRLRPQNRHHPRPLEHQNHLRPRRWHDLRTKKSRRQRREHHRPIRPRVLRIALCDPTDDPSGSDTSDFRTEFTTERDGSPIFDVDDGFEQ